MVSPAQALREKSVHHLEAGHQDDRHKQHMNADIDLGSVSRLSCHVVPLTTAYRVMVIAAILRGRLSVTCRVIPASRGFRQERTKTSCFSRFNAILYQMSTEWPEYYDQTGGVAEKCEDMAVIIGSSEHENMQKSPYEIVDILSRS